MKRKAGLKIVWPVQPIEPPLNSRRKVTGCEKLNTFSRSQKYEKCENRGFFPDKKWLLLHVRSQLSNKGKDYTDKEVYRLRKIVAKLKLEFNNDEEYDGI